MFISLWYRIRMIVLLRRGIVDITKISTVESSHLICLNSILILNTWFNDSTLMFVDIFLWGVILGVLDWILNYMWGSSRRTVWLVLFRYTFPLFVRTFDILNNFLIRVVWTLMLIINSNNSEWFDFASLIIMNRLRRIGAQWHDLLCLIS